MAVLLLSGNNQPLISSFFTHMDDVFECLTCSNRVEDVIRHLRYVVPDAFVYCLMGDGGGELTLFKRYDQALFEKGIPVVVVGSTESLMAFRGLKPSCQTAYIEAPISPANLKTAIQHFLRDRNDFGGRRDLPKNASARKMAASQDILRSLGAAAGGDVFGLEEDGMADGGAVEGAMPAAPKLQHKPGDPNRVLVVDDDSNVLKFIKGALGDEYSVATAISGKVALKFLETKAVDLILLDYEMPTENGADVFKKILENPMTKDIPVVFLTGTTDKDKVQEVLSLKPRGYLLKPVDVKRLHEVVKQNME